MLNRTNPTLTAHVAGLNLRPWSFAAAGLGAVGFNGARLPLGSDQTHPHLCVADVDPIWSIPGIQGPVMTDVMSGTRTRMPKPRRRLQRPLADAARPAGADHDAVRAWDSVGTWATCPGSARDQRPDPRSYRTRSASVSTADRIASLRPDRTAAIERSALIPTRWLSSRGG